MYSLSPHTGLQSTVPYGLLQKNTQWLLSQREHSSPTQLTMKFRTRSGGFYSDNWRGNPPPIRAVTATKQRGGPTQHLAQAPDTATPNITPNKRIQTEHSEERQSWHPHQSWDPHQNQPLHQKYWIHTVYTEMLAHKNTLLRPQ